MPLLTKRYHKQIAGLLGCFDRVIVSGMLPQINHARGMAMLLKSRKIRIFDYARTFAEPLREKIRANAERIAAENGVTIEFVPSAKAFRKEDRIETCQGKEDNPLTGRPARIDERSQPTLHCIHLQA